MDGVSYVTEIYTCNPSDSGFDTKLELLIRGYKKHLYIEMGNKILSGISFEEIEDEVESTHFRTTIKNLSSTKNHISCCLNRKCTFSNTTSSKRIVFLSLWVS